MRIDVSADLKPLQRAFVAFGAKQAPFATALALTTLAKGIQGEEQNAIEQTFESPTPFTVNSIAFIPATKSKSVATVYAREIASSYLLPYVEGGDRSLGGKKGMIVPENVRLNQYGNLPKGTLARFKGKPDVFIGSITFKKTGRTVSGVWQRNEVKRGTRRRGGYGTRGAHTVVEGARTTLKLLLKFEDTTPVEKNLDFYGRANAYLRKHAAKEFGIAMKKALASKR